ncbi:glycosyltransferase family 2 protein [Candidatus Symbiopectobacterium sp. NZEC135]|uniref:glycosyltransferase family 2 protein n=1 Tax=Candidatus Symbiopectobacterium sp. NZEC135 TaxID=2820471 RepID=UPI002226945E|nr:glycosyltransferase [Candidatus Symbiopectobacterium sp. NZEC135]MCW2481603.1 glycosyltransferase [Candidatus Symbiopectobacterium sp. NZEC135]
MHVSVVLTTRNSSSYITRALDALSVQSNRDFEVIIVDDASDDVIELSIIVNSFQKKLNIKTFYLQNKKNASYTRNYGASKSIGDVISFHDADDIWARNKVEVIIEHFQKEPNQVAPILYFHQTLRGTYDEIDSDKCILLPSEFNEGCNIVDYLINDFGVIQTSTISINRSCLEKVCFDDSLVRHQDIQYCIDAYLKNVKFSYIQAPLSYWVILEPAVNAVSKGASVDFCIDWVKKNRKILSELNIINYYGNVISFISIKERCFFKGFFYFSNEFGLKIGFKAFSTFCKIFISKIKVKIHRMRVRNA